MTVIATESDIKTINGEAEAFLAIREFLVTSTPIASAGDVSPDTPLLDSGVLDSLGILQLMTFIGEQMGVEVSDDDFIPENFQTVGSLSRFVAAKRDQVQS